MAQNNGKIQHVTPHPDGGWQVKGATNQKATLRFDTQEEAIAAARKIAINQGSHVVIHRPNGQVRGAHSYTEVKAKEAKAEKEAKAAAKAEEKAKAKAKEEKAKATTKAAKPAAKSTAKPAAKTTAKDSKKPAKK